MDALKRILPVSKLNNEYLGRLPLKVLDLAIGWPEGLQLLSTSWNSTGILSEAIELASFNYELESLKVLCQYPAALFKNIPEMCTFMISLLRYGGVVVKELALRREKLAKIALDVFPAEDRTRFFLDDSSILDVNARTVYKTLQERDVPMLEALNPGPAGSIFGFVAYAYTFPSMTLTGRNPILALDDLYDRGFRDIDLPEEISEETVPYTPLQRILNNGDFRKTNHWVGMCAWFLIMGGSPRFQGSASIKNALFGIANTLGDYEEGVFLKYFNSEPIALLIRYAARLLPPLETDGCICFCSSKGCLPLHLVLRGPGYATTRHRCAQGQATRIWSWIKGCGIRGSAAKVCLEESVRLELFNRLGMRHTCCLAGRYMTDSDRAEIRMESEELQTQLELLMSAYRNSRDNEEQRWGSEFSSARAGYTICCECDEEDKEWPTYFFAIDMAQSHRTGWLKKARAILPVDRALEAWCFRDSREDFYEQVETLCLKRLGYEGCNFVTIIRRHFREDLSMEESGNTESESQRFVSSNNALLLRLAISWIFMEADEERDQNLIELTEMALDDYEDLLDLEG